MSAVPPGCPAVEPGTGHACVRTSDDTKPHIDDGYHHCAEHYACVAGWYDDAETRPGIYRKFRVERTDGSSAPGGKHAHCGYFVLDLEHDSFAWPALKAYAAACQYSYPELSADLEEMIRRREKIDEAMIHAAEVDVAGRALGGKGEPLSREAQLARADREEGYSFGVVGGAVAPAPPSVPLAACDKPGHTGLTCAACVVERDRWRREHQEMERRQLPPPDPAELRMLLALLDQERAPLARQTHHASIDREVQTRRLALIDRARARLQALLELPAAPAGGVR